MLKLLFNSIASELSNSNITRYVPLDFAIDYKNSLKNSLILFCIILVSQTIYAKFECLLNSGDMSIGILF